MLGRPCSPPRRPADSQLNFKVDPELCVTSLTCVRVCPADAFAVEGDKVRILDDRCTRCGICLPACPHEAIIAVGDADRARDLLATGQATLILSVESRSEEHTSALQSQSK